MVAVVHQRLSDAVPPAAPFEDYPCALWRTTRKRRLLRQSNASTENSQQNEMCSRLATNSIGLRALSRANDGLEVRLGLPRQLGQFL
jgi:hypothetical protein